jgi:hypothetical protein
LDSTTVTVTSSHFLLLIEPLSQHLAASWQCTLYRCSLSNRSVAGQPKVVDVPKLIYNWTARQKGCADQDILVVSSGIQRSQPLLELLEAEVSGPTSGGRLLNGSSVRYCMASAGSESSLQVRHDEADHSEQHHDPSDCAI